MDKKHEAPKHLLLCKILGLIILPIGVALFITGLVFFGDFERGLFSLAMVGLPLIPVSIILLTIGFRSEMVKLSARTAQYIQQETKEELTDIASTSADISSEAITKTAKAVRKGLKDTIYCKHCGAEIDSDSKFCKTCGKSQD